jgi:hypothetical protein
MSPFYFQDVLSVISKKNEELTKLPIFKYLNNDLISPQNRLGFAPCVMPFAKAYDEFNQYVLRDESSNDPIQKIINSHTYEESGHFKWLFEDIESLGFNTPTKLVETVTFLYGKSTLKSRKLIYQLFQTSHFSPIHKLVVVEVLEATSYTFFSHTAPVTQKLQDITGKECRYFGYCHLNAEAAHAMTGKEQEKLIANFALSSEELEKSLETIEIFFNAVTDMLDEFLSFALNNSSPQLDLTSDETAKVAKLESLLML